MKNGLIILCLLAFSSSCWAEKKDDKDDEKEAKEVHVYHHYRREPRVGLGFGFGSWPYFWVDDDDDYYPRPWHRSPGVSFNFGFSGGGGHRRRHHRR